MPPIRISVIATTALLLAACSGGDLGADSVLAIARAETDSIPPASRPADPDLELERTCRGHPKADELTDRLPTYIKELVVMWPRAGRMEDAQGRCRSVARLTTLNHQGVPITVSFVFHGKEERPSGQDYRLLSDASPPRAVMDMVANSEHPNVLVEAAGAPSTSREALEGLLEFLHPEQVVSRLVTGE